MMLKRMIAGCLAGLGLVCGVAGGQTPPVAPGPLWEQATVYRDEWGVPHVFARNAGAMAFAFGYAQAEDHLAEMLLAYRYANGRAAEVLGEAAAASDAFAIKMGHGVLARQAYGNADAITLAMCDGFALGVNQWILDHPGAAPEWAEGVEGPDVLALFHAFLMSHAPYDVKDEFRPAPAMPSANAWAAGPTVTGDSAPILVMNPHVDYAGPFHWYEAHLVTPDFNLEGATIFGLPMLLMGHNAQLGWGLAPNEADFADVYTDALPQIKRNPKSVTEQAVDLESVLTLLAVEQSRPYYVRTANGFETRSVQQVVTAQGAMMGRMQGQLLRYRVGGFGEFGGLRQLYEMARASTLERFQEALMLHQLPCFHVVYGDRAGNVFYLYNAKVGRKFDLDPRANPTNSTDGVRVARSVWDGPVSGQDTNFAWGEIVPPPYLPSLLNPESGYVQACGTPPWLATADTGTTATDWPRWFARDRDSYRAKRVRQLLDGGVRSFDDHQAMLYDLLAPFAADAVPYLLDVAKKYPEFVSRAHPDLRAALDMLRDWNYLADTKSMAMTYFHVWWTAFQAYAPGRYTPDELYALLRENSPEIQRHALQSAEEAAKMLRNEFQTLSVPWGDVHVLRRGAREVPMPGAISGEPLFRASESHFVDKTFPVRVGPGFAMVVRFGSEIDAVSIVPFGSSENPASPHYDDQLDLMVERRFKYTRFAEEAVFRNSTRALGQWANLHTADGMGQFRIHTATPAEMSLRVTDRLNVTLPVGAAPFSLFAEPIVAPRGTAVEIEIAFAVDGSICMARDLSSLKLYGYDSVNGWASVAEQTLNAEERTIRGRVTSAQVYGLLGPGRALLAAPSLEQRATPKLLVPKPAGYHPLSVHRDHEGEVAKAVPSESELTPTAPPGAETPKTTSPSLLIARELTREESLLEPADGEARPAPRSLLERTPVEEEAPAPPPAQPAVTAAPLEAMEPTRLPFAPREEDEETDSAGVVMSGIDAARRLIASEVEPPAPPPSDDPAPSPTETAREPKLLDRPRVSWSMKPLTELVGRPQSAEPTGLYLAPENAIASPVRIGTNLQLAPPTPGALFHVTTDKTVRAQVYLLNEPPAPLPSGLTAFTPMYKVAYAPWTARGTVVVSLTLNPKVCAPEHAKELKLYSYNQAHGWQAIPGQKFDPAGLTYSVLDPAIQTYVVFGPTAYRRSAQ